MSPDLKRLCEAAWKAETGGRYFDHQFGERFPEDGCDGDRERHEAIVRAVLTELREASDEMIAAVDPNHYPMVSKVIGPREAMIDRILAEPAKA